VIGPAIGPDLTIVYVLDHVVMAHLAERLDLLPEANTIGAFQGLGVEDLQRDRGAVGRASLVDSPEPAGLAERSQDLISADAVRPRHRSLGALLAANTWRQQ
jgi:hypothetical protein